MAQSDPGSGDDSASEFWLFLLLLPLVAGLVFARGRARQQGRGSLDLEKAPPAGADEFSSSIDLLAGTGLGESAPGGALPRLSIISEGGLHHTKMPGDVPGVVAGSPAREPRIVDFRKATLDEEDSVVRRRSRPPAPSGERRRCGCPGCPRPCASFGGGERLPLRVLAWHCLHASPHYPRLHATHACVSFVVSGALMPRPCLALCMHRVQVDSMTPGQPVMLRSRSYVGRCWPCCPWLSLCRPCRHP